jgi:hypothetical protein
LMWKLVCLVLGWISLAFVILLVRHSHWKSYIKWVALKLFSASASY